MHSGIACSLKDKYRVWPKCGILAALIMSSECRFSVMKCLISGEAGTKHNFINLLWLCLCVFEAGCSGLYRLLSQISLNTPIPYMHTHAQGYPLCSLVVWCKHKCVCVPLRVVYASAVISSGITPSFVH